MKSFRTFWYNFGWLACQRYVDGWVPRFAFFVPILGYLILFNDQTGGNLKFHTLMGVTGLDSWISGQTRLRLVYFGLIALGTSNLLYHLFRPELLRLGATKAQFTRIGLEVFAYTDFLRMHESIRTHGHFSPDGNYDDKDWDGFSQSVRRAGELQHPFATENWDAVKLQNGSLLRRILGDTFLRENGRGKLALAILVVWSTIGYALLALPSIDVFVHVVRSTMELLNGNAIHGVTGQALQADVEFLGLA